MKKTRKKIRRKRDPEVISNEDRIRANKSVGCSKWNVWDNSFRGHTHESHSYDPGNVFTWRED